MDLCLVLVRKNLNGQYKELDSEDVIQGRVRFLRSMWENNIEGWGQFRLTLYLKCAPLQFKTNHI